MASTLDELLARTPGTCGGRIRIDGTRITVHRVALLYQQGMTAEDIEHAYPQLSLAQIYAALAYYHAHRDEIDSELVEADRAYDALKNEDSSGVIP